MDKFIFFFYLLTFSKITTGQILSSNEIISQVYPILDMANKLERFNNEYKKCSSNKDGSIETFCLRTPEDVKSSSTERLVYKATHKDQIPASILNLISMPSVHVSEKYPLYISIALENDNILLGLVPSGNDVGYTHGVLLDVGGTDKKGITWGGSIFTGLYSKKGYVVKTIEGNIVDGDQLQQGYNIDGIFYERIYGSDSHFMKGDLRIEDSAMKSTLGGKFSPMQQFVVDKNGKRWEFKKFDSPHGKQSIYFKEESIFKAFANNNLQGKWYLWSAEAGFSYLNSQHVNDLLGTGIQKGWHALLKNSGQNVVQYHYIPDQNDEKIALHLKASIGVQKDLFLSKNCVVKISSNVGYRYSASEEPSYVFGNVSTQLQLGSLKKSSKKLILSSDLNVQKNNKNLSGDLTVAVSYQTKKITYFSSILLPFQKANASATSQYQDYDPIQRIGVIIPLIYER